MIKQSKSSKKDDPTPKKECLIAICIKRRIPKMISDLYSFSYEELTTLVGDLSPDEIEFIIELNKRREPHKKKTKAQLLEMIAERELSAASILTKIGLIDFIIDNDIPPKIITLDSDQAQAVALSRTQNRLLICAGPGSGKTTTVCEIAKAACEISTSRVIILVFNVCAEVMLIKRLKALKVKLIDKNRVGKSDYGVCVITFDKFAHQINLIYDDPFEIQDDFSYRIRLERAANHIKLYGISEFTHVIVDEAQDVVSKQSVFIDAITKNDNKLIIAGDPRQELYAGANWYSKLWAETPCNEKIVLHYNHRSSKKIVDVINTFSRTHFPNLHHDQIATRDDIGNFSIIMSPGEYYDTKTLSLLGKTIAKCMIGGEISDNPDVYAIAPITLNGWRLESVTLAARQTISTEHPGFNAIVLNEDSNKRMPKSYEIATALKIKGTEKSKVVVFGVDCEYKIKVDRAMQLKSIFVAISRARDDLTIVCRSNKHPANNCRDTIGCLQALGNVKELPISLSGGRDNKYDPFVRISNSKLDKGLSGVEGLELSHEVVYEGECVNVPLEVYDTDFVGCYVEALIAEALGMILMNSDILKISTTKKYKENDLHIENDNYILTCSKKAASNLRKMMGFEAFIDLCAGSSSAYIHTVLMYTIKAGLIWTVSERLLLHKALVGPIIENIKKITGDGEISYLKRYILDIPLTRSEETSGVIIAIPDFIINGIPIEIKHTKEITDIHRRQAATYATVIGAPYALLYNTQIGQMERISAITQKFMFDSARAMTVLERARYKSINELSKFTLRPIINNSLNDNLLISVDVETTYHNGKTYIIEIGAVIFNASSAAIIAVFNETYLFANDALASDAASKIHGLNVDDFDEDKSAELVKNFYSWVEKNTKRRTFLHWGGCEHKLFDISGEWLDCLHKIMRPWLEHRKDPQTSISLENAIQYMIPECKFAYHSAFEDAIATAAIFIACMDYSSIC